MPKQYKHAGHKFNGEMRVRINRKIYPDIDEQGVMDLVQAILEGEHAEGIEVEVFEVRGEDETATITKYDFAAAFMRSAERVEETEIQEVRPAGNIGKKGKRKHRRKHSA